MDSIKIPFWSRSPIYSDSWTEDSTYCNICENTETISELYDGRYGTTICKLYTSCDFCETKIFACASCRIYIIENGFTAHPEYLKPYLYDLLRPSNHITQCKNCFKQNMREKNALYKFKKARIKY